jgi:hypothetical protein
MTAHGPILVETMVAWIHPQVMMFLGKVKNPMTDTFERNLPAARMLIDVLAELEEKTEGRLSADEERLLRHTLTGLRLNWLDENAKPGPEGGAGAGDSGRVTAEAAPEEAIGDPRGEGVAESSGEAVADAAAPGPSEADAK